MPLPDQTFLLPDGGELLEPHDAHKVQVGERWLPTPIFYRHPGGADSVPCEVKLEVWDGVPVCTDIRLNANPDKGTHVRVRDLRALEDALEERIEDWFALVAYIRTPAPGRLKLHRAISDPEQRLAAMRAVRLGRRRSRRNGKAHLQETADAYNAAIVEGQPTGRAVMRALNRSMPTARKYIREAREAGLLND